MDTRNFKVALIWLCSCFALVIGESPCECPGPIQYYKDLGCTPVFKKPEDCCPERYNCDHLKSLPNDKCFINGHTYEIGESLREEDANPCDVGCFCSQGVRGPEFTCAVVDCFYGTVQPGCYRKRNATSCCIGHEFHCPEKDEDRPTCIVDGKTYRDGEYFKPAADPEKECYCGEGYTGENVEPFCVSPKHSWCGTMLRHIADIRENCVPTYYYNQSPKTSCSVAYRCQNNKDLVFSQTTDSSESKSASNETENPDMLCKFGNLTMHVGSELTQATDYSSVCVKCVCEVPPIPTCQRLSDEECDVTKHPNFGSP